MFRTKRFSMIWRLQVPKFHPWAFRSTPRAEGSWGEVGEGPRGRGGESRGRVEAVWMVDVWRARKAEEPSVEGEGGDSPSGHGLGVRDIYKQHGHSTLREARGFGGGRGREGDGRAELKMLKTIGFSMIWKLQAPKMPPWALRTTNRAEGLGEG